MGTRALITKNRKSFIATHWDGYPSSLGRDLLNAKGDAQIIAVAKSHTIDAMASPYQKKLNEERQKKLAKKHKLSLSKIKKGVRRGAIISAEDYEINPIKIYGDFAEYQYDLDTRTGQWSVRDLEGEFPQSLKTAGKFKPLKTVLAKEKLKKVI